jgi:hypothetical protein
MIYVALMMQGLFALFFAFAITVVGDLLKIPMNSPRGKQFVFWVVLLGANALGCFAVAIFEGVS